MKCYTVHAKRWAGGWELRVEGVGVTQCRVLSQARQQATDLIETYTDEAVDLDAISVI